MIDRELVKSLSDRIVQEFKPVKIILFGSYAYGSPKEDSDVDLMVILAFEGKSFRKSLEILNRVNPSFPVDLLARRPEDVERRYVEGDPLIREAIDRGETLYEQCS